jgi:hypothetical protein
LHTDVGHRCYRAERCAEWEWDTDPTGERIRVGRPINAEHGLCPSCVAHTEHALHEMPRDYTELHELLGRTGGTALGEPVTASRELPTPLRLDVEATMAAMVTEATCWAETVAEIIGVEWDTWSVDHHTRPGPALQRATRLLAGAISPLLAVRDWTHMVWTSDGWAVAPEPRDGVDGAATLLELHHRCRRLCGLTRLRHRMTAWCPRCERPTLMRDDGEDWVWCAGCAVWLSPEDYTTLTSTLAAVAREETG